MTDANKQVERLGYLTGMIWCPSNKASAQEVMWDFIDRGMPAPHSKEWNTFMLYWFRGDRCGLTAKIKTWFFRALALVMSFPNMPLTTVAARTNAADALDFAA